MQLNTIHQSKKAQIWRMGGMIWLIFITAFFASIDLYFAKLQHLFIVLAAVVILSITIGLLLVSIKLLRLKIKLEDETKESYFEQGSGIKKWFLIIFALEVFCLNAATFTLLFLHHYQYIVAADILIVALHFIPLGRIFIMQVYYWLGITVSLIAIMTLFFVPVSSQTGNLTTLAAIPSISFIILNWVTVVYILKNDLKLTNS